MAGLWRSSLEIVVVHVFLMDSIFVATKPEHNAAFVFQRELTLYAVCVCMAHLGFEAVLSDIVLLVGELMHNRVSTFNL